MKAVYHIVSVVIFSLLCIGSSGLWESIEVLADGYTLHHVMSTAFGNPKRLGLLPDGSIVIADPNNDRIAILKDGTVRTLAAGETIFPHAATPLADGRVCYYSDGAIYIAGRNRVVAMTGSGNVRIIADGLNNEPVWLAVAPNGIVATGDPDMIYRISPPNVLTPSVYIEAGIDPKSLDENALGNVWFSTEKSIYRVVPLNKGAYRGYRCCYSSSFGMPIKRSNDGRI